MQCAVIEYARNVIQMKNAHSMEFAPDSSQQVVIEMPEHNPGQMGGTMRLGRRRTIFNTKDSTLCNAKLPVFHASVPIVAYSDLTNSVYADKLYGSNDEVWERHRHRYEVNPDKVTQLEKRGLHFVGKDETGKRMEILELKGQCSPLLL